MDIVAGLLACSSTEELAKELGTGDSTAATTRPSSC
jgi:hypothetical protein